MSFTFAGAGDNCGGALRVGASVVVMDPFTPYERAVTEEEYAAITAYWPSPEPHTFTITGIDHETKTVAFRVGKN